MARFDATEVRERLDRLAAAPAASTVFGFDGHHFRLSAPIASADLERAERAGGYRLPAAYRQYLTELGDGGAGPGYGIFPFGSRGNTAEATEPWGPTWGDPAAPFEHTDDWNLPDAQLRPPSDLSEGDEDEWFEAHDRAYFAPALTNGSIPIGHLGCAMWVALVVRGERTGAIWLDDRANDGGIRQIEPRGFEVWYLDWLADAERQAGIRPRG